MELILNYLLGLHPLVLTVFTALGALVVIGQTYIALSPSEKDDAWYAKMEAVPILGELLAVLKSFAPIQRKEKEE